MTSPRTWVVGASGLLGRNVARLSDGTRHTPSRAVRWGTSDTASQLGAQTTEFAHAVGDTPWQVMWCAGAGVTGTTSEQLDREVAEFRTFLTALFRSGLRAEAGVVFLASSAGGVYAGASHPPFDERTVPNSLSPYGDAKLAMEDALASAARETGARAALGRISNLYGPGQNLAKAQGLLSQIIRSHLLRRPISIFVSLDTIRDYIYAPDCAALALDLTREIRTAAPRGSTVTKVLASQRGLTIAAILGELRRLLRRPPELIYGSSPNARFQVRDLRLRSVVLPHLDARPATPIAAGLSATINDLSLQLQRGALS